MIVYVRARFRSGGVRIYLADTDRHPEIWPRRVVAVPADAASPEGATALVEGFQTDKPPGIPAHVVLRPILRVIPCGEEHLHGWRLPGPRQQRPGTLRLYFSVPRPPGTFQG